jgi:hypothetical protein
MTTETSSLRTAWLVGVTRAREVSVTSDQGSRQYYMSCNWQPQPDQVTGWRLVVFEVWFVTARKDQPGSELPKACCLVFSDSNCLVFS